MPIRLGTFDDAGDLARLRWQWNTENGVSPEPLGRFTPRFKDWMRTHGITHEALVAFEQGAAVGMAWLAATDRLPDPGAEGVTHGDLQSVYLVPELRSSGRGSDLVKAVIARARDRGMVVLTVRPGRRSRVFYERLGFTGSGPVLQRAAVSQPLSAPT